MKISLLQLSDWQRDLIHCRLLTGQTHWRILTQVNLSLLNHQSPEIASIFTGSNVFTTKDGEHLHETPNLDWLGVRQ